ncbi:MAG: acyltransferase [Pasteurella oralis]|uniref:acyltransferase n=1 Tax=Pasteurella oralis TaxID=1071947 RepID=UPI002710F18D|nr:acyltransferase [Pasteurella oralis]
MANELTIEVVRKDGSVDIIEEFSGIAFEIYGKNNVVRVFEDTKFDSCFFCLSGDMYINISETKFGIVNLKVWGKESKVFIGENFSCWGVEIRCHEPNSRVSIGKNCMFSEDILIYPTDVHAIFDSSTGEVLNIAEPIVIGDHCWCSRRVTILKGITLDNNIVIGAGSIVTNSVNDSNVIIAGNPAKVIKTNIDWNRWTPFEYQQKFNSKKPNMASLP